MTTPRTLIARVREWLRRGRVERDLDDELQSHLDHLTDEHVRRGLDRDDARRAALREFGGVEQAREAVRDRRGFRPLDDVIHDLRYAVRLLIKAPGFTTAAILTLGLGIGANAAIFSLVDAVMFRPLPYREPAQLVAIWDLMKNTGADAAAGDLTRIVVSPANLRDYRRATNAAGMAAYSGIARALSGTGTPERLAGEAVSSDYFAVLGTTTAHGRLFMDGEAVEGAPPVVVLSHGFWVDRFGGQPTALGRTLMLDGQRHEIVGVMPPGFQGVSQLRRAEPVVFWIPLVVPADMQANRGEHILDVVARLAPGASAPVLTDELRGIATAFGPTGPASVDAVVLGDDVAEDVRPLLWLLFAAVGVVLLLACVNVASLLLVRSIARRREIAVRLALGATRGRVARELLTQSAVLAGGGAAAGLVFAVLIKDWLVALTPATMPRLDAVAIDGRVLLFTIGVTAVTAIVFGWLPALQLGRASAGEALGTTERVVAGSWATRARAGLMIAEVAFSTLLLIGAGLMIRSLVVLNQVELGFDTSNVLLANLRLPDSRYATPQARLQMFEAVAERVRQLPGVEAVSFANRLPMRGGWTSGVVIEPIDGAVSGEAGTTAGFQSVSPGYFDTLRMRLVRGRLIGAGDREGAPPAAVVNEEFVRKYLGAGPPVGRRIRRFAAAPSVEIVGVVADVRRNGRTAAIEPEVYLPAAQTSLYPLRLEQVAVRFNTDAVGRASEVRGAIWAVDPDQPITAVLSLDQVLAMRQGQRHFQTFLFSLFAVLALVLAVVGIYGVVAYAVSQRTAEIGLRMALGASRGTILRWVVGHWLRLVSIGSAAGAVAALLLGRTVRSLLFEISPADPLAFASAVAVLGLAALSACLIAARAATRVNAIAVLK